MDQGITANQKLAALERARDGLLEINQEARKMYGGEPLCATIRRFCAAKCVSDPMDLSREDRAILIARLSVIKGKLDHASTEYLAMCAVSSVSELSPVQYSIYNERLQAIVHREDRYPFPK